MASGPEQEDGWVVVARVVSAQISDLGVTQMEVATRAGVSLSTIQELSQGKVRRRYPRTLAAVSEALGFPADYLANVAATGSAEPMQRAPKSEDDEIVQIKRELARISRRLDELEASLDSKDAR